MPDRRTQKSSLVPGMGLEGYADEITAGPGEHLTFRLGGPPGKADFKVVRLLHGDPNPSGPGYREEEVDWAAPETIEVGERETDYGSYIEIPHSASLNPPGEFTLALWFQPTLRGGGWRTLAAKWSRDNLGFGLFFGGEQFITAAVSHDGRTAHWATAREFAHVGGWQFVAFTYDPLAGEMGIYQRLGDTSDSVETRSSHDPLVFASKLIPPGPVFQGASPLLFGACEDAGNPGSHQAHFTGKIAHPALIDRVLSRDQIWTLSNWEEIDRLKPMIGCWDLSEEVSGSKVVDTSGNANHGVAVNAPGRAVTGPFWSGLPSRLFTECPGDYNAIYFHADDLEDAGWEPSVDLAIPEDVSSGIYTAKLENGYDRLFIPFVVSASKPTSKLGFLVPTLTWQAYGSNRAAYSYTEDGVLDRTLCTYDVHEDGSTVYYYSRRQPTRGWNPTAGFQNWGAHNLTANLYLIDWLEQTGIGYDVFADEDLHERQLELLSGYSCVLLGSHPEYWTESMVKSIIAYTRQGGRVLYLGGNGVYWVMSIDPERPHIMELRRGGEGDYGPTYQPAAGESQHSTTLELGGLWSRRGLPARGILGVEHAANVWTEARGEWGFERLPASRDPKYGFIFEGVGDEETVGNFGLNLGSAAGFEMDAVQPWMWDDATPEPVVLARAAHASFMPPRRTFVPPVSDMTILNYPDGGAVFSAGSVTWTGSLSHNHYGNNVSRITRNVIARFLEVPAGESVVDSSL